MITRTHINTLADNTPKSRRRVRRTLEWRTADYIQCQNPTPENISNAQGVARMRELAGARSDAAKRRAKP